MRRKTDASVKRRLRRAGALLDSMTTEAARLREQQAEAIRGQRQAPWPRRQEPQSGTRRKP